MSKYIDIIKTIDKSSIKELPVDLINIIEGKTGKAFAFNETHITDWFEENYKRLGFVEMLKCPRNRTPDYKVLDDKGKKVGVEIEILSSGFLSHKFNVDKVDVVVCAKKDIELIKPIIELVDYFLVQDDFDEIFFEMYPKHDYTLMRNDNLQYSIEELRKPYDKMFEDEDDD